MLCLIGCVCSLCMYVFCLVVRLLICLFGWLSDCVWLFLLFDWLSVICLVRCLVSSWLVGHFVAWMVA